MVMYRLLIGAQLFSYILTFYEIVVATISVVFFVCDLLISHFYNSYCYCKDANRQRCRDTNGYNDNLTARIILFEQWK